jgi:hypothetical protein
MSLEGRLYHYGLGAGVPYGLLNSIANAFDVAFHASDVSKRKRVAREILATSKYANFLPQNTGFAHVEPDILPGTQEVLAAVRGIIAERRITGWKKRDVNPVDHLELPEHFRDHPELLRFALSDVMLEIVSGYYGLVPQLKEMGIWITREQKDQYNSQLFHLDKPEVKIVGLFMNVELNGPEKGPTTVLPADKSDLVRRGTNYEAKYFRGEGFIGDETVFKYCKREDLASVGGPPGTGAFVDTSRCFHFGSRCRSGERVMLMVKFMLPHKARKSRTPLFDLVPEPADEARRLALSGVVFKNG